MDKFPDIFNCKLYNKEDILKWELPEKIKQKLGIDKYNYFFLAIPKEESHEGHKHIHLSVFPTEYSTINVLEAEISTLNPKILEKILKTVGKHKFDIITSTGTCKAKNICYFGIFFSKPAEANTEDLQSDVNKINEVKNVKISNYTCDGYCEE